MTVTRCWMLGAAFAGLLGCAGSGSQADPYPRDTTTLAPGQQLANPEGWHRDAVIYHVWVKAFADGVHGDGIGDLPGIVAHLDHIQSLGVNTIWLSPIFACAYTGENMHGYDTTDFYAVNERFGTLGDVKSLLDGAHARGIRVLFDFVPNHTSTSHTWFQDPATRGSHYVWQASVPANWGLPWGGGTATDVWRPFGGSYFYSAFSTGTMADLNYREPAVPAKMADVIRFWLDRGFDGMRVDAVRYLVENGPGQQADQPETHAQLRAFRSVLDAYRGKSSKVMIAEAWTSVDAVAPYYGNGSNEFHMCLDFDAPGTLATAIRNQDGSGLLALWDRQKALFPSGAQPAAFDSNHDNVISRPGTTYAGDRRKIILAEAMNLLAPGTPILYYGNEVGQTGPAGKDLDLRQPMDWAAVQTQDGDPQSILNWTRALVRARTSLPALRGQHVRLGTDCTDGRAVAFLRSSGGQTVLVVANFSAAPLTFTVKGIPGVTSGGAVNAVIGDLKGRTTLSGTDYTVGDLPPWGVRILHLDGTGFPGTLHGDLP